MSSATTGILILSRGKRLSGLLRHAAADLSKSFRVAVAINSVYEDEETQEWEGCGSAIQVFDFRGRMRALLPDRIEAIREMVPAMEARLGLSLYRAAGNYVLYERFCQEFGLQFSVDYLSTEEQLLREYAGSVLVMEEMLAQFGPTHILFETVDLISTYVAHALMQKRGGWAWNMLRPRISIEGLGYGIGPHKRSPILEHFYQHPDQVPADVRSRAESLLASFTAHEKSPGWFKKLQADAADRLLEPGRLFRGVLKVANWKEPVKRLKQVRKRAWCDAHMRRELKDEPFILFFLHHQPEASTFSQAPRWVRQESVIEQLSIHAPAGLRIAVKENPKTYGIRSQDYFESLERLKNVDLYHPGVDTNMMIERARGIITITGSVGVEALLRGQRVGILAGPDYGCYRGLRQVQFPDQFFAALDDPTWQPSEMTQERLDFLAAYLMGFHPFGPLPGASPWPEPHVGGPQIAVGLARVIGIVREAGLRSSQFDTPASPLPPAS